MKLVSPPFLVRKLYSTLIWRIPTAEKKIYLTFDDGPIQELTPWVLDTLKSYHAKATFFCVGQNVERNPALYERILHEGHAVGNHTYDHCNGWKTKDAVFLESVRKCAGVVDSTLFRPPYGKLKKSQISALKPKFSLVMWDVLSYDFDQYTTKEQCYQHVIRNTKAGSVVVFHDNTKAITNLTYALPLTLAYFTEKGFRFEAIGN